MRYIYFAFVVLLFSCSDQDGASSGHIKWMEIIIDDIDTIKEYLYSSDRTIPSLVTCEVCNCLLYEVDAVKGEPEISLLESL